MRIKKVNNHYDVIVIGLGIMGAATLWRSSKNSSKIMGIDASSPTYSRGSSQGSSRIFRQAYWEGCKYLPLLRQANLLWNELEQTSQMQLIVRTGGIFIGHEHSRLVAGSINTAMEGSVDHEIWTGLKIKNNFPAFNISEQMKGVFEPGAYAISASNARSCMLNQAVKSGATAVFGDCVTAIENHKRGVLVKTRRGQIYVAKSVIVTTGPWIAKYLMPELNHLLDPRQVPVYWFKPKNSSKQLFSADHFPVFLYERQDGSLLYGLPSICNSEPGVKIGFHNRQQTSENPQWKGVPVQDNYINDISEAVSLIFPELETKPICAKNCYYTMSIDESFLIDRSQTMESVYFASVCSGHGFKFAPAIGDALANMAFERQCAVPLSEFEVQRFNSISCKF